MIHYYVLASGSKGNSCLIQSGDTTILIDCGTTRRYLFSKLSELQIDIQSLSALLITHDHSDHISQIKYFNDLPIYAPCMISKVNQVHRVIPYQSFMIHHVKITPIELSHDTEIIVGYIIDDGQEKLVYITDTGYIKQADIQYCQSAHHIIIESNYDIELLMQSNRPYTTKMRIMSDSGHLSNELCGHYLSCIATHQTKSVTLAHLSQEANEEVLALQVAQSYLDKTTFQGILQVAKQFEVVKYD